MVTVLATSVRFLNGGKMGERGGETHSRQWEIKLVRRIRKAFPDKRIPFLHMFCEGSGKITTCICINGVLVLWCMF